MRTKQLLSLSLVCLAFGCSRACDKLRGEEDPTTASDPAVVFEHTGEMRETAQVAGAGRVQNFNIDVAAGDQLVVTASSSQFDPMIHVTPPGTELPLTNDDWEGSREHAQLSVVIPQAGTMKVSVTSARADARGSYRLLVRRAGASAGGPVIAAGQTHDGTLAATDPRLADGRNYQNLIVQGQDGGVRLTVTGAAGFSPMVLVVSPGGTQLSADASGAFLMGEPGLHRVQVLSAAAGQFGSYQLSVAAAGGAVTPTLARSHHQLPQTVTGAPLTLGQTVQGTLAASDPTLPSGETADLFQLQVAQAGQQIGFELESSAFDPYLMLIGPTGRHWENDDAGGTTNSSIALAAPTAGLYRLVATAYRAGETGAYSLKVSSGARMVAGNASERTVVSGELAAGDSTLADGEFFDTHAMTFTAGQAVRLQLTSSSFDTYLIVRPPGGGNQQENDDGANMGTNALVEFVATVAGEYQVLATSYGANETGAYELALGGSGAGAGTSPPVGQVPTPAGNPTAAAADVTRGQLAQGDQTLGSGEFVDYYNMTFEAGQTVQLRAESTTFDAFLLVRTPGGQTLENDDLVPDNTNAGVDIPLAEAGEYRVMVTSYRPGETGAYILKRNSGASTVPRPGGTGGRVFGLFAGITDYPDGQSDLPECANDALKLAESLRESNLLTVDRQVVLTNSQATVGNIRSGMQRLSAQMGPNDVFVFFYSGHGGQTSSSTDPREIDNTDEYLALYDGQLMDGELGAMFNSVNARISLVAIDACYSGGFAKDIITRPGRVGMFSSEEDVLSAVAGQFQAGGYLSHFLREAVSGQADSNPRDSVMTVGELTHHVYTQFGAHAQDVHMAAAYQHLVVDRGAVGVDQVLWSYR